MPLPTPAAERPPCPASASTPEPSPAPGKPARSGQVRCLQHVCAAYTRLPRAIAAGAHLQRPRCPPAKSNCGRRNTPTPPKPARPFICRAFGATQCQARLRGDVLGTLGSMHPPDPPQSSWQLTAGSDPDPGRLKQPQIPGQPRMSSPAGRWRRRPIHGRPKGDSTCRTTAAIPSPRTLEDDFACWAMEATPEPKRRWAMPRPARTASSRDLV